MTFMTIVEYAATLKKGDKVYLQSYQNSETYARLYKIDRVTPKGWIKSRHYTLRPDKFGRFIDIRYDAILLLPIEGEHSVKKQSEDVFIRLKRAELVTWIESGRFTKEVIEKLIVIKESFS